LHLLVVADDLFAIRLQRSSSSGELSDDATAYRSCGLVVEAIETLDPHVPSIVHADQLDEEAGRVPVPPCA
jgi:hypothetical protein